jgi:hypothetical protein
MHCEEIPLWMADMVEQLSHPVQAVQSHGIVVIASFQISERLHVGAELVEIVESHGGTVVQGWFLVNRGQ